MTQMLSLKFNVSAFPVADLFGNFDIVYTSSGSTAQVFLVLSNVSDGATTQNLSVKAIDISQDPENSDVSSDAINVYVVIQITYLDRSLQD